MWSAPVGTVTMGRFCGQMQRGLRASPDWSRNVRRGVNIRISVPAPPERILPIARGVQTLTGTSLSNPQILAVLLPSVAVMLTSRRLAFFSGVLLAVPAQAQTLVGRTDSVYTWRGALPSGALLSVRNFNGPIDVRPAQGATAEVRAEKRTSRGGGSIQDVAFEVQTGSNGDVTICATYRNSNPCDDDSRRGRDRDDDYGRRYVTVGITVLVPRGAQVKMVTGNGAISIEQVGGDVQATTGNGRVRVGGTTGAVRVTTGNGDVDISGAKASVRVTTGNGYVHVSTSEGPVEARSGNGDIDVSMTSLSAKEDMTFSTGSGGVRVTLPSGYNGELDATTGNGELRSDFDLKIQGRMDPRRVRATIGDGGPRLRLTTGNGRLEIRRGA